jgi:cystathionine gamma-lyase
VAKLGPSRRLLNRPLQFERHAVYASASIERVANPMTQVLDSDLEHGFGTRAVHAGQAPDPLSGAVMTPIYQTSTYAQEGLGRHKGFEYARTRNPTRDALERNVASLEGGRHGFAFGSGLAALDAVLKLLKSGDHVIGGANMYGGSHRLMERVYTQFGLTFTFADMRDLANVTRAITPATRMIYAETPTNPNMHLTDLAALADIAQAHGLVLVVDNTFATPCLQQPLALGADIVLHSTTKYLNGHSDMVGGLLVTSRDDLAERLGFLQNASGAVPGPMDCWLALRGTKTLELRMERHNRSAQHIAEWLEARSDITAVYYPGLPSHPQHELAKRQMNGFGGMISFDLGDVPRAKRVVEKVKLFTLAESLGGVESLIGHPASMTHASVPPALRQAMGLTDSLLRLSVGIEDVGDLIADLDQALA